MTEPIYLDGFATLPLAAEAREAMVEAWSCPGNASSPHGAGERAAALIERARADVATLIGAAPSEIYFTSGATEANNLAVLGAARALRARGSVRRQVIVSAVEHKAVLEPARRLEQEGFETVVAPVDRYGRLDLDAYRALLGAKTLLVSVMAVNNETGVVQPVAEAAASAHAAGALFHSDAAQAVGKIPVDVTAIGADYLSLSAHKCYGPMGIGALYVAATSALPEPLQYGGGQQSAVRPGTEPVALIAGFAAAAAVAHSRLKADGERAAGLARLLLAKLEAAGVRHSRITGAHYVVPGSIAIAMHDCDAEDLCLRLARDVYLSTGSACTSGQLRTTHVLEAMGFSEQASRHVVRAYCHRYLEETDIGRAAELIAGASSRHSRLAAGEVRQ